MLMIGDVTGKGIEAAALTSLVRHTMRAASEFESSPAELLARVDSILKKQRARSICTALCMRLFEDRALLAAGGHPLPLHVSSRGVNRVGEHGPLLGGFSDVSWENSTVELEPDSILVAYTDGVTDAIGADGTRYGLQRLCDTLAQFRGRSATAVIRRTHRRARRVPDRRPCRRHGRSGATQARRRGHRNANGMTHRRQRTWL